MANTIFLAPTANFVQKTLSGALSDSATTITLSSTTNLTAPGSAVINRQDSAGNLTPSAREVVYYTGISGNDLTGVTRNGDSSGAKSHADGSIVEFTPTVGMWNNLATVVSTAVTSDGYLKAINSPVSIARLEAPFVRAPQALISVATILSHLNVSGASLSGFFSSGASGAVLTSQGNTVIPLFAPAPTTSATANYDETADNANFSDTITDVVSISVVIAATSVVFIEGGLDARTATNPASFIAYLYRDATLMSTGPNVHTHVANERTANGTSFTGSLAAGTYNFKLRAQGGGQGATYTVGNPHLSVMALPG